MPEAPKVCEDRCPLCGQANACRRAFGADPSPDRCWCESLVVSPSALARIPSALRGRACLCMACARSDGLSPVDPRPGDSDDTYVTADGRIVFTSAYLLRRGHCCGSGCRHCPYDTPA
ncbi:MAG: cysteine-rich CWC family protein [Verrucomicrobiota bacterium]